jgi:hypothetical protein
VSADRRFATAYNAALQDAKMAIACTGYCVVAGAGHHRISFEVVKLEIGKAADPYSDYFDRCRRKRNVIDYDNAFIATETGHGDCDESERVFEVVQTVVETPTYLAIANKLFSEEERADIVALVAADPECGD